MFTIRTSYSWYIDPYLATVSKKQATVFQSFLSILLTFHTSICLFRLSTGDSESLLPCTLTLHLQNTSVVAVNGIPITKKIQNRLEIIKFWVVASKSKSSIPRIVWSRIKHFSTIDLASSILTATKENGRKQRVTRVMTRTFNESFIVNIVMSEMRSFCSCDVAWFPKVNRSALTCPVLRARWTKKDRLFRCASASFIMLYEDRFKTVFMSSVSVPQDWSTSCIAYTPSQIFFILNRPGSMQEKCLSSDRASERLWWVIGSSSPIRATDTLSHLSWN